MVNYPPVNLASILDPHPAEDIALISRSRTTSYGDLRDQVAHLRGGLVGLGVEPGDRVVLVCANNWYFVASYFAVLGTGAVALVAASVPAWRAARVDPALPLRAD